MGRKSNNSKDLTSGLKGWEKKYIHNSIKYGHLNEKDTYAKKKVQSRR
jgi:hypothetical protein